MRSVKLRSVPDVGEPGKWTYNGGRRGSELMSERTLEARAGLEASLRIVSSAE